MNDLIALISRHRSIRRFAEGLVSQAHVRLAVAAGQSASTSSAIQSYCVIRVTDPGRRRKLAGLTGPQQKVAESGAFFIICGDTRRHRLISERAGRPYDARLEAFLLAVIDSTLFVQNMVLAFESLGYAICYIGGLRNNLAEVDRLLEIPTGIYPFYGLCVGVPAEEPTPRPRLPVNGVLFEDRYPDDATILGLVDEYDSTYRAYGRQRDGAPRLWSTLMTEKFAEPRRVDLGRFYRGKGANFT